MSEAGNLAPNQGQPAQPERLFEYEGPIERIGTVATASTYNEMLASGVLLGSEVKPDDTRKPTPHFDTTPFAEQNAADLTEVRAHNSRADAAIRAGRRLGPSMWKRTHSPMGVIYTYVTPDEKQNR